MKKIITGISISLIALVAIFASVPTAHAATGIYLTPSSGTYAPNATFNVQLRLASDSPGVQANLTFDRTKLQITNVSKQGSDFSNNTTDISNNNGTITVYAINGGDKNDQLISTFTFQAISGGEAPVSFTGTNRTLRYVLLVGVWTDATTTNASYTITGGNPTPPVTPPVSGGGTTTAPKPKPAANKPVTAPTSPVVPAAPPAESAPSTPTQETPSPNTTVSSDESSKATAPPQPTRSNIKPQGQEVTAPTQSTGFTFPWMIAAIIASVLALTALVGLIVYRNSHMSKALQRLIAAVIEYRLALNQQAASIHPTLAAPVIMPKLLAFTAPKLLGTGVKQKLLAASSKIPGIDRFTQR